MATSQRTLIPFLGLVIALSMMLGLSEARAFVVGGNKLSWKVPSFPDEFNKWAEKLRFEIGDSIDFKYDGKSDSVLQVGEEAYKSCNKSYPMKSYDDGNTKVTLDNSGPFYFISGAEGHCEKGQKLEIVVLSAKHGSKAPAAAPSEPQHHQQAPTPARHHSDGGSRLSTLFLASVAVVGFLALV